MPPSLQRGVGVALLSLASHASSASAWALPAWQDLFPSLSPLKRQQLDSADDYSDMWEDDGLGEDGEPRLGFVQLNTGTTGFNTTLNLTGHILLGLGIASSLLMYMYLRAFQTDEGGSGYGYSDYGVKKKRSLDENIEGGLGQMIPPLLAMMEEKLSRSDVLDNEKDSEDCYARMTCEANRPEMKFEFNTIGDAAREVFSMSTEFTSRGSHLPDDPRTKKHLIAMSVGRQGKNCKEHFPRCKAHTTQILDLLSRKQ